MEKYKFIDRFFHSQYELLDLRKANGRDFNTLYTFLNNLHTTADRLKEEFNCDIKRYPEFKILRLIRNYFHHVGDVEEIRLEVYVERNVIASHTEHLIIPLETFAKSVKSFIDKQSLPEKDKNYARKKAFIDKEMAAISELYDTAELLTKLELCCNKPSLEHDGVVHELGFDIYKFIFNIINIVADKCREIDQLNEKKIVAGLDCSYTANNNIGKHDVSCLPSRMPITTTHGFVFIDRQPRARALL